MASFMPRPRSIRSGRSTSIDVVTPPTAEPVDLATARLHLRLDATGTPPAHPDDALLTLWTAAAREECERYTNRRLMTQTVAMTFGPLDGAAIELPIAPVQTIEKLETAAGVVAPGDYVPFLGLVPVGIAPMPGAAWADAAACTVTAVVGYPSAEEVPPMIRAAILLLLGQAYQTREAGGEVTWGDALPVTVARLLAPYRVWLF